MCTIRFSAQQAEYCWAETTTMRVSSYTSHQLAHDGMNDLKMVDRDLYLNPDAPPSDAKPSVVLGGIVLVCRSTASVQRLQKAPKKVHGQSLGVMRSFDALGALISWWWTAIDVRWRKNSGQCRRCGAGWGRSTAARMTQIGPSPMSDVIARIHVPTGSRSQGKIPQLRRCFHLICCYWTRSRLVFELAQIWPFFVSVSFFTCSSWKKRTHWGVCSSNKRKASRTSEQSNVII